ncbi:sulfatase [Nocardioidaceae bacterium]|nr:sulfatase [Nocardioidaceae bacterium]
MSRRAAAALGAFALSGAMVVQGAVPSSADTVRQRQSEGEGPHAVVRTVVDNDGPRVGVTVKHARAAWDGQVRLTMRVPGEEAGFIAEVRHGVGPERGRLRFSGGKPWRCGKASLSSPDRSRTTTLSVPRHCLRGASTLEVDVRVRNRDGGVSTASVGPVAQQSRPNIVMIMVDDMRADDLEYMPLTRRLIGDKGVTFDNGLAPYPLCCPARASVLSGLYTHNHRVFSHVEPWGFNKFDDESTIATWLDDAGYTTTYVGKYLNGYGNQPEPGATTGTSARYVPRGWDDWKGSIDGGLPKKHPAYGFTYSFYDTTLNNNGRGFVSNEGRYNTYVIGQEGRKQIRRSAKREAPFFSYISFVAPHFGNPTEPDDPGPITDDSGETRRFLTVARPPKVRGMFDDTVFEAPGVFWDDPDDSDRADELADNPDLNAAEIDGLLTVHRQRLESLHVVDQEVRKIVRELERSGEREETMIVFTSDNGYFLGEHGVRQGKTLPYEPSLRVPLLMSGPGIPAGQRRQDPFLSIDFAPTFADLADVRMPYEPDGISLLPSAQMGDRGWNRPVLTETGPASTVRMSTEDGDPIVPGGMDTPDNRFIIGIRTPRYLFTDRATGFEELYDLRADPNQYDNVVDELGYVLVSQEMRRTLRELRACDGKQCRPRLSPLLR